VKKPYAIAIVGNSGPEDDPAGAADPSVEGKGYHVGVVKHDAHRFDIDHPGKDSHRLTAAGPTR